MVPPFLRLKKLTVAVDGQDGFNRIPAVNFLWDHSYSNMKSFIFVAAVLKAAAFVSANDLAAMDAPADTWCITYLSTYIAAVTNQGDLSPSAQNSGRLPFAPSIRPTFARNTSVSITRSAMSMNP